DFPLFPELEFYEVEEIVQLTDMAGSESVGRITISDDGYLHMAYAKDEDVFIMHSQDGYEWTGPDAIEQGSLHSMHEVDICQATDGTFWAVMRQNTGGSLYEDIYLSNSSDGINWIEPWVLVETGTYDTAPRITAGSDGSLWVLYSHSVTTSVWGDWDLYVLNSTDGMTWSAPQQITDDSVEERWGDIYTTSTGAVHVTYQRYDWNDFWIYETHSDDGVIWTEGTEVVNETYISQHGGSLAYNPRYGFVTIFSTAQTYDGYAYFLQSMNGISWSTPTALLQSDYPYMGPDIVVTSNRFYISYIANPTGDYEIYLAIIATVPPITGTVTDENLNPVLGTVVELYNSESTLLQTTTTDVNGTYTFYGLEEGEEYDVVMTIPTGATTEDLTLKHAVPGDVVDFHIDWCILEIQLTGEFDYLLDEPIKIRISALVTDAETHNLMTDATETITIYGPTSSSPITQKPMIEHLPGVYVYTSPKTIAEYQLSKGIYLAYVNVSYSGGPSFTQIMEFHIDPPAESMSSLNIFLIQIGLVGAGFFVSGWLLRDRLKPTKSGVNLLK
ncbi:MAG: carboxypeptidase regulatory-like domain-containing protein, partial [Candidatus Thorarchaeota archaeon]